MRLMLLFPPGWMPYAPYLALPRLTAYMRQKGYEVTQRDLNLETYLVALRPAFLQTSLEKVRERLKRIPQPHNHPLQLIEAGGDYLISEAERLTRFIRSEEFLDDPIRAVRNVRLLNACLRLAVASSHPTRYSLNELQLPYGASASDIKRGIQDENANFTRAVMRDYFLDSVLDAQPDLVGISISCYQQIIPALTLAALIKERKPELHITLGGNTATRIADALVRHKDNLDMFDSLVLGEGELALEGLAEAVGGQRKLEDVPGLVYRAPGGDIRSNPVELPDLNTLPTADFDGLPLDKYMAPQLMLPLVSSRGCHWGKCAFCERGIAGETVYQFRQDDLVIKDIRTLKEKYHTRYIEFNEDDIPPTRLLRLARKMLEANLDIEWFALGRLEKTLTPEVAQTLYQAGCRALMLGLESGSQRVLDLMEKGITLEQALAGLQSTSQAGIWNECFMIVGFPTENYHEFQESLDFIARHKELVHSISLNTFYLAKYAAMAQRPGDFHLRLIEQSGLEFLWSYSYMPDSGLTAREANDMNDRFWHELKRIYPNLGLRTALAWETFYLFISRHGADFVKKVALEHLFDEKGWEKRKIQVHPSVILQAIDGKMALLHDLAAGKRFALKPAAYRFLELCRTGITAEQAMQTIAQTEGLQPEVVKQLCLSVLKTLAAETSISWEE